MAIERHFLEWDEPVVDRVRQYLIPEAPDPAVDLRNTLVLVPTRHAGRRLREALTVYCARRGAYLLAPMLQTPVDLVSAGAGELTAGPLEVSAAWTDVLRNIDVAEYPGLFPSGVPARDFSWALSTGAMLQRLRDELAEHGMSVESIVSGQGEALQEHQRWIDLARLERLFVLTIETRLGLRDPCSAMLGRSTTPTLPPAIERVVLACSPDPTPIALRALETLSERTSVDVLVHAPITHADSFDSWGRPRADRWRSETINITEADLMLASSPSAQSRLAMKSLTEASLGPHDIAVGVPDDAVIPHLETVLSEHGIASFNPAGAPLGRHPVFQLMERYRDLIAQRSYSALSGFLRNADVLEHLRRAHGTTTQALLTELDEFQNEHLPTSVHDVAERLRERDDRRKAFPALAGAMRLVESLPSTATGVNVEQSLRSLLQSIYSTRELRPGAPDDQEFRTVAERVDEALHQAAGSVIPLLRLSPQEGIELLLRHLAQTRYSLERPPDAIDLEGWLELPWDDAPLLVVTGMNDGAVPQRPSNEAFLPESLRSALGLRTEVDRLARDVYLARTLVESRRRNGRVCFISGKYGQDGEPLRPSRLLFHCVDAELPRRAKRLFGPPDDVRPSVPSTVSFRLRPSIPPNRDHAIAIPRTLAVTAFRDYLSCPFRFYLKRVLNMESLTDAKAEMDALDFGDLIHDALARLAAEPDMRDCTSAALIRRHLLGSVDRWASRRFGPNPPLHLTMQLDIARERLGAAAEAQAFETSQGWQIVAWEKSLTLNCGGMTVKGRVDRVDRHRSTGVYRVLDYKSSEKARTPEEFHFGTFREDSREYSLISAGGKTRRWIDLQLPFYVWMFRAGVAPEAVVHAGYFNLPRDTDSTGVALWDSLDEDVLAGASVCAQGVVSDVMNARFWPPASRVDFDDFESLFPGGVTESVDGEEFAAFLEGWPI